MSANGAAPPAVNRTGQQNPHWITTCIVRPNGPEDKSRLGSEMAVQPACCAAQSVSSFVPTERRLQAVEATVRCGLVALCTIRTVGGGGAHDE
jgi:hypothetical protein